MNERLEIASKILAGMCANPAIFQIDGLCGFRLANATEYELSAYALGMADKLISAFEDTP